MVRFIQQHFSRSASEKRRSLAWVGLFVFLYIILQGVSVFGDSNGSSCSSCVPISYDVSDGITEVSDLIEDGCCSSNEGSEEDCPCECCFEVSPFTLSRWEGNLESSKEIRCWLPRLSHSFYSDSSLLMPNLFLSNEEVEYELLSGCALYIWTEQFLC